MRQPSLGYKIFVSIFAGLPWYAIAASVDMSYPWMVAGGFGLSVVISSLLPPTAKAE